MANKADDLVKLEAELGKADSDIVEGERRVTTQLLRVERLKHGGHVHLEQSERLLRELRQQLEQWRVHRDLIFEKITLLKSS